MLFSTVCVVFESIELLDHQSPRNDNDGAA